MRSKTWWCLTAAAAGILLVGVSLPILLWDDRPPETDSIDLGRVVLGISLAKAEYTTAEDVHVTYSLNNTQNADLPGGVYGLRLTVTAGMATVALASHNETVRAYGALVRTATWSAPHEAGSACFALVLLEDGAEVKRAEAAIEVRRGADLALEVLDDGFGPSAEHASAAGRTSGFILRATNRGEAGTFKALTDAPLGWSVQMERTTLRLGPNEQGVLLVNVTSPEDAADGTVTVRLQPALDPGSAVSVALSVRLSGTGAAIAPGDLVSVRAWNVTRAGERWDLAAVSEFVVEAGQGPFGSAVEGMLIGETAVLQLSDGVVAQVRPLHMV